MTSTTNNRAERHFRPTREARLHLVIGNARFLILDRARVPHLASKVLGMATRCLADHWRGAYGCAPVLVETFVEVDRFSGTSYKAANWISVAKTAGRGKRDRDHENALPVKDVYVYPRHRRYRWILTGRPDRSREAWSSATGLLVHTCSPGTCRLYVVQRVLPGQTVSRPVGGILSSLERPG